MDTLVEDVRSSESGSHTSNVPLTHVALGMFNKVIFLAFAFRQKKGAVCCSTTMVNIYSNTSRSSTCQCRNSHFFFKYTTSM